MRILAIIERVMYNLERWMCNAQLLIQMLNWSENVPVTKVWFSKRPLYRTCISSACRSDLRIIWERHLDKWHFCWLIKSVWYCRSYNIFETSLRSDKIRGGNLAWSRSYLRNRKQYICIKNESKTNEQNVTCGVPEGSILGPLLIFNICKWFPQSLQFIKYYNLCRR